MANKLNTVAKGDAFEDKVFCKMKELLESDMLGLSPSHSKIFKKKAYPNQSGNKIIFDISIESYHSDSNEYSTLTLIECKDYSSPIKVEKLRDFAYRIKEVGGHKGYFIATSHFQRGARDIALNSKIGLAKFNIQNSDVEDWIFRRVSNLDYQKKQAIQDELYCFNPKSQDSFVAICEYDYYSNFLDFFTEQILGNPCEINVENLSNNTIKSIVSDLVEKMQYQSDTPISTEFLVEIVTKELNLKLIQDKSLHYGELGICNFSQRTINISPELQYDSPRWRFTLAHEIGHYILHDSICSHNMINIISDDEVSLTSRINDVSIQRLECQANKFASYLLIPENIFTLYYLTKHKQLEIPKFPHLYLDHQPCNKCDCYRIFSYLGRVFNVSNEVIKIKLKVLGYLTINESTKKLRDII